MSNKDATKEYFKHKAKTYDIDNVNVVLEMLPVKFKFLDAGYGTCKWSYSILKKHSQSERVLVDISNRVLKVKVI